MLTAAPAVSPRRHRCRAPWNTADPPRLSFRSLAWLLQALPASPPGRPCTEHLGHPGLLPLCHLLSCQDAPSMDSPETPVARAHFGSSSPIRALCAQPGAPWWPPARVVPPGCPPHESPETASACVCFSSCTVLSGCPHWGGPGTPLCAAALAPLSYQSTVCMGSLGAVPTHSHCGSGHPTGRPGTESPPTPSLHQPQLCPARPVAGRPHTLPQV